MTEAVATNEIDDENEDDAWGDFSLALSSGKGRSEVA
jgi:hypothetical protein